MSRPRLQVVVGIMQNSKDEVLMVRNNKAPSDQLWSLPGGKADRQENLHAALQREVFEETGLKVEGTFRFKEMAQRTYAGTLYDIHYFDCTIVGGRLDNRPDNEIVERLWISLEDLGNLEMRYKDNWDRVFTPRLGVV